MSLLSVFELLMVITTLYFGASCGEPCAFNRLCTCSSSLSPLPEVLCVGVPLTEPPQLPHGHYYRVNIIGAEDIHSLDYGYFKGTLVSYFTLRRTRLSIIDPQAFVGTEDTLTSLDLSNNQLTEFPSEALKKLPLLQWLSLKGNQISDLRTFSPSSLITLLLSDNLLTTISDQLFVELRTLQSLDLDGNMIHRVEGRPFPPSLTSLSLAQNVLEKVPLDALQDLRRIKWLIFRGNLIRHLPYYWSFPVASIEILDLSHNVITNLATNSFSSKQVKQLQVSILHLDYNYVQLLPASLFANISIQRLSLSNNKISLIEPNAFLGPLETSLTVLDLNYNRLEEYPLALLKLSNITSLFLRGNRLAYVNENAFELCKNKLQALDLSSNFLSQVPSRSLAPLTNLLKLNLEDNEIEVLSNGDLGSWAATLLSLSLSKNGLRMIDEDAFKKCQNLRELRLSNNKLYFVSYQILYPLQSKLNTLELSFSSVNKDLVEGIKDMIFLEKLELDHNNGIRVDYMNKLSALVHVDQEGNQIETLGESFFFGHKSLRNVVLSRNKLQSLDEGVFTELEQVLHIALFGNEIQRIQRHAFQNLPKLQTVMLASNKIGLIEEGAFSNLTRLTNFFIQENKLEEFSLNIFDNLQSSLIINASHNLISKLLSERKSESGNGSGILEDDGQDLSWKNGYVKVRVLDLNHNNVLEIPADFMRDVCVQLHFLDLSHNRLESFFFDALAPCLELTSLSLSNNRISKLIPPKDFCCKRFHVLNLSNNLISNISNVFGSMYNLKILDLSNNNLEFLSHEEFLQVPLTKLSLKGNRLRNFHFIASLSRSLKHLDVSSNSLKRIPKEIALCTNLAVLDCNNNLLDFLEERFLGNQIEKLVELDLSHNQIKQIHEKTFLPYSQLKRLRLKGCGLHSLPFLSLPELIRLDVSQNSVSNMSSVNFSRIRKLKYLDISGNGISDIARSLWRYLSHLVELNLARNPIDILDSSSLAELKRLRSLDIRGLNLKYIDTRILHNLKHLIAIKTTTFPNVRSFRLQELLAKSSSLRMAQVEVQESTLSHQIQWAFGPKLKELIINGPKLNNILPDAFLGFYRNSELILRITGTNITRLPHGFLRYLADVRFLTIDLRWNQIKSLNADVFISDHVTGSRPLHAAGGLLLEGNRLECSCNLLWLSSWLRQWMREANKLQRPSYETLLQIYSVTRKSRCALPVYQELYSDMKEGNISLIDLHPQDVVCNTGLSPFSNPPQLLSIVVSIFLFQMITTTFIQ